MTIEAKEFKIEMTHNELWNTAFDVKRSIETALKTHWVNHQSNWENGEKESLERCKKMFVALGRTDLFDEIFSKAKKIFEEFNENRKKEQ